ncbi:hypothetical protein DKX38_022816 [Salix brachista]|uniref:Methyltransferase n=1 Tax=Salix brachista TaxID=2182728 RepID=A0A5N5KBT5_9ROSI|nr:hypothetical protein DKX38_022816 [Salix brachista]
MGRMEEIWGGDCLEFKPERWISNKGELGDVSPYRFTAFNAGPRACIGKELAMVEMKAVGAAVIWNYSLQVVENHPILPSNSIVLHMKHGLKFVLFTWPDAYKRPFSWPKSRDYAWFKNLPFKKLCEVKKTHNWVRLEGDLLVFPDGGTSFRKGVKGYVDEIKRFVPLRSGSIRTVLDVGCGVSYELLLV